MHVDHLQSTFARVYEHLVDQGLPAYDPRRDEVRYRVAHLASPVGFLLGDHYTEAVEGQAILESRLLRTLLVRAGVPADDLRVRRLLASLERLHEQVPPIRWLRELAVVAADHEVAVPGEVRRGLVA
ncbi:MAG: hypothetical protein KC420_11010 [Myxococcales bacterium]|nr:hypothetical protein [Myxococcales bacterium]